MSIDKLERLVRFSRDKKRVYAPKNPILLRLTLSDKLLILLRFSKGDNKTSAPLSPIELL